MAIDPKEEEEIKKSSDSERKPLSRDELEVLGLDKELPKCWNFNTDETTLSDLDNVFADWLPSDLDFIDNYNVAESCLSDALSDSLNNSRVSPDGLRGISMVEPCEGNLQHVTDHGSSDLAASKQEPEADSEQEMEVGTELVQWGSTGHRRHRCRSASMSKTSWEDEKFKAEFCSDLESAIKIYVKNHVEEEKRLGKQVCLKEGSKAKQRRAAVEAYVDCVRAGESGTELRENAKNALKHRGWKFWEKPKNKSDPKSRMVKCFTSPNQKDYVSVVTACEAYLNEEEEEEEVEEEEEEVEEEEEEEEVEEEEEEEEEMEEEEEEESQTTTTSASVHKF